MSLTPAALKAQARLREETLELCLRGDLYSKRERLQRELQRELNRNADSLNSMSVKAKEIADELAQVESSMQEATHVLNFRALPVNEYQALVDAHTAEKDGTFPRAFWYDLISACLFDPEAPEDSQGTPVWTPDEAKDLIESGTFSDAQYSAIISTVFNVNQDADVPF